MTKLWTVNLNYDPRSFHLDVTPSIVEPTPILPSHHFVGFEDPAIAQPQ